SEGNQPGSPDVYLRAIVTAAPEIPLSWPLIIGDCLTNARAALDHAVYPHVRRIKPALAPHRIKFPIVDSEARFAHHRDWFDDSVRGVVAAAQPYHHDDSARHPLAVLRAL